MNVRLLLVAVLFLLAGLSALLALQWKFGLGQHIVSPQRITVALEARFLVGGGRAGVEFVRRRDDRAQFMVRCTDQQEWVKLRIDEMSGEICSVRIRLLELSTDSGTLATSRAHLEVTWGPEQTETVETPL